MTRARKPKRPMHARCCVRHTGAGGTLRFHLSDADLRRWLRKARLFFSAVHEDYLVAIDLCRDIGRTLDPEGWRKAK